MMAGDIRLSRSVLTGHGLWHSTRGLLAIQAGVAVLASLDIVIGSLVLGTSSSFATYQAANIIGRVPVFVGTALSIVVFTRMIATHRTAPVVRDSIGLYVRVHPAHRGHRDLASSTAHCGFSGTLWERRCGPALDSNGRSRDGWRQPDDHLLPGCRALPQSFGAPRRRHRLRHPFESGWPASRRDSRVGHRCRGWSRCGPRRAGPRDRQGVAGRPQGNDPHRSLRRLLLRPTVPPARPPLGLDPVGRWMRWRFLPSRPRRCCPGSLELQRQRDTPADTAPRLRRPPPTRSRRAGRCERTR